MAQNVVVRHHAEREEERKRHEVLTEEAMAKMTKLHQTEMDKLKQFHLAQIGNLEEKHEIERRKESEAINIEKREWIQIMNRKHSKEAKVKEVALREMIEREQREEIEVIMDRLSTQYEERLKAAQSHHDHIESGYKEQILREKERVKEFIEKMETLHALNGTLSADKKELDRSDEAKREQIERLNQELEALRVEADHKRTAMEHELTAKCELITDSQRKCKALENEMNLLRDQQAADQKAMQSEHGHQIEEIERRVKRTLSRKDQCIDQLKQQIVHKNQRILQIEKLVDL